MSRIPVIPQELRVAQEQGNLVLFCGAGVSKAAGLPLFKELVNDVYKSLQESKKDLEEISFKKNEYDRALLFLERRVGADKVRGAVANCLSGDVDDLTIHKSLLELCTQPDERVRLVTTNYDDLFQRAAGELGTDIGTESAPFLPVPGRETWNSVVHLHGSLDQKGEDGNRLVLTAADFGAAYLTQGWASVFVTELFRRNVVLFAGYSAEDTAMRYILDAVAADQKLDKTFNEPWVLADFDPEKKDERRTVLEWKAKGVRAIPFQTPNEDFGGLVECLADWASDWRDGVASKLKLVRSMASADPNVLRRDQLDRVIWALRDKSGVPARGLVDQSQEPAKPAASMEWLRAIARAGLLGSDEVESQNPAELLGHENQVFQRPPRSRRLDALAPWLHSYTPDREFYWWYIRRGASMQPWLCEAFSRYVSGGYIPDEDLAKAWEAAASGAINVRQQAPRYSRSLPDRIEKGEWSIPIKHELLEALSPRILFSDSGGPVSSDVPFGGEVVTVFRPLIDPVVVLGSGSEGFMIRLGDALATRKDDRQFLSEMSVPATALLFRAADLWDLSSASWPFPLAYYHREPIGGLGTRERTRTTTWTLLVDLAWESFKSLDKKGSLAARRLYLLWSDHTSLIVRGLAIKAAGEAACLTSADRLRVFK